MSINFEVLSRVIHNKIQFYFEESKLTLNFLEILADLLSILSEADRESFLGIWSFANFRRNSGACDRLRTRGLASGRRFGFRYSIDPRMLKRHPQAFATFIMIRVN